MTPRPIVPLVLALLVGCASTGEGPAAVAPPAPGAAGKEAPEPSAKKPSLEELEEQLVELREAAAKARREAGHAEAELALAEAGARIGAQGAEETVRKATAALELARMEQDVYGKHERPLLERRQALSVSNAEHRLQTAVTDLEGLEAIFAEEVEATAKPEILRRGRHDVERAREQLALARSEAELAAGHQVAIRLAKLSDAVRAAEAALAKARAEAERSRTKAALDVEKATGALEDERREARKALEKVTAKERQLEKVRAATGEGADAGEDGEPAGGGAR